MSMGRMLRLKQNAELATGGAELAANAPYPWLGIAIAGGDITAPLVHMLRLPRCVRLMRTLRAQARSPRTPHSGWRLR